MGVRSWLVVAAIVVTAARAEAQAPSVASFDEASSSAESKPTPAARRFELPPPREFRLENGLRFLVQRDTRQPLFAFIVSYEVGHRDDPPGYEGLAHLAEHLSFRGSRHLGARRRRRACRKGRAFGYPGRRSP